MDIWKLECFAVLARELNFTRAARELRLSQSALSRQIQSLERDVGCPLFVRSGGTRLTEVGQSLLPEVTSLLDQVSALERLIESHKGTGAPMLRLFLTRSMATRLSTSLLAEYRRVYPDALIELETGWTSHNLERLAQGEADLVFVRLPLAPIPGVEHVELRSEPLLLAVPEDSPLAAKERVPAEDLQALPLVHWPRRQAPGSFDALMQRISPDAQRPPLKSEPSAEMRLELALRGEGMAIVTETDLQAGPPGLVGVPIVGLEWGLGLAWQRSTTNPYIAEFVQIAQSHGISTGD